MKYSAYHTHSTFSDGKNTMEEMVLAAIDAGMPILGISDHSDSPYQKYCMRQEQYPAYLQEIERLQEKYGDKITLLKGIELDSHSDPDIVAQLDYFLGSVHELVFEDRYYGIDHGKDIQQACIDREFGGDIHGFEKAYFDELVAHIQKTKPTIVGHVDVITKFSLIDEDDPIYQDLALNALKEIIKVTPVLEVNTGAISRGVRTTPYPGNFILEQWLKLGGELTLGADTHATNSVICGFDDAIENLRRIGYTYILVLQRDGFHKQAI